MSEVKKIPELRFPEFVGTWQKRRLGQVAAIITGSTPSTSNEDFYGGKRLFVSPMDINENRYVRNTNTTITELGFAKTRPVNTGSVMFVCIGSTIGKVGQATEECATNQQINSLFATSENENDFIFSLLEKNGSRIKRYAGVQAVPQINKTDFSAFSFLFPTLPEQQKIASFLSAVDAKIEQLNQKKTQLEQYKKGAMQQIFTQQIRFKDENGNNYPDWEEKKLGDLAFKESSNISANAIEDNEGEYKIYGATGLLKTVDFFREEQAYISIVKDGAGVGRTLLCEPKSSVLGTLDIIKPRPKVDLQFLYETINRVSFSKYITGSTIPHIYFKDYAKAKVRVPYLEEQIKIGKFLSAIDDKIELVNTQLANTQQFKKGLLQKMFV